MHVLIVPSGRYGDPREPLGGIFQRDQARALKDAGVRVGILAPQPRSLRHLRHGPRSLWRLHAWDDDGVPVLRFDGFNVFTGRLRRLYESSWAFVAEAICRRYFARYGKPDLIHAHNIFQAGAWASGSRARDGVPLVVTEHSSIYWSTELSARRRAIAREVVAQSRALYTVSTRLGERLTELLDVPNAHARTLPNVLPHEFTDASVVLAHAGGAFRFLCIAGLVWVKDHQLLLESFATVARMGQDVRLDLVGDGPLRRELQASAERLGVAAQVTFHGYRSRAEILSLLTQCDVVVSTSRFETFGVTLIEALAAGRPVIAMQGSGPDDFIDESNGLLVPSHDRSAVAAAMQVMIERSASYRPVALRKSSVDRFGSATVARLLISEYERVLSA